MPRLAIEHNLCRGHLKAALVALAQSEGLTDEVAEELLKALRDDTRKEPRNPLLTKLLEEARALYDEALDWVERYVDRSLQATGVKRIAAFLKKAVSYKEGPLTPAEIREIQEAIEARFGFLAAQIQSEPMPPKLPELERWKKLGLVSKDVTPANFAARVGGKQLSKNAFLFGRMQAAIEKGKTFQEVLDLALAMPLLKPDRFAIAAAEQATAAYVTAFGQGLARDAAQAMIAKNQAIIRGMAVKFFERDLEATRGAPGPRALVETWQDFSRELRRKFADDPNRDWDRVAWYELHDAEAAGRANRLLSEYGPDQLVYKQPMPTACPQCKHLYLRPDGKPRVFKLREMLAYGNNIGRKPMPVKGGEVVADDRVDGADTLKPVVGQVHPWCQCQGPTPLTGLELWA